MYTPLIDGCVYWVSSSAPEQALELTQESDTISVYGTKTL